MHVPRVSDRRRDRTVIARLFTIAVNALFLHWKFFPTIFLQDVQFLIPLAVSLGSCVALVFGRLFPIPCSLPWNIPVELTSSGKISMLQISSERFLCSHALLLDQIFCLRVATSTTTVASAATSAPLEVCIFLRDDHTQKSTRPHDILRDENEANVWTQT